MTGPNDLYKYKALLLPWSVRGLDTWNATGMSWHDGDTFNCIVSNGRHGYDILHVRCAGFNAPEINTVATREAAIAARDYARSLVDTGGIVYLDSLAFSYNDGEDNFGRALAIVTLEDGRDLAQLMINSGNAVPD